VLRLAVAVLLLVLFVTAVELGNVGGPVRRLEIVTHKFANAGH
jgi:hypothetical protein